MYNYQSFGVDKYPPSTGITILHIDESLDSHYINAARGYPGMTPNCWPFNGKHYGVAVLAADGNYNLEKKVYWDDQDACYHADGVAVIDGTTSPSTDQYQKTAGVRATGIGG